jgi:hypothetical protein
MILISVVTVIGMAVLAFLGYAKLYIKPYKVGQICAHKSWAKKLNTGEIENCFKEVYGDDVNNGNFSAYYKNKISAYAFEVELNQIHKMVKNNPFLESRIRKHFLQQYYNEKDFDRL